MYVPSFTVPDQPVAENAPPNRGRSRRSGADQGLTSTPVIGRDFSLSAAASAPRRIFGALFFPSFRFRAFSGWRFLGLALSQAGKAAQNR
jgi:hypothetical protein